MKLETIKSRLAAAGIWTKKNMLHANYTRAAQHLTNQGEVKLHLCYWSGTRRHMTLVDSDHRHLINMLDALRLKYETGNDAPRGGAAGEYILIPKSELKKVEAISEIL